MIGTTGRTAQEVKSGRRFHKIAVAGVTAAAITSGIAMAPSASAALVNINADFTWDPVYSSGLVASLLNVVSKLAPGVSLPLSDTISFSSGPPPALGLKVSESLAGGLAQADVNLTLNLRQIAGSTKNLYNTEAGIAQPGCNQPYGTTGFIASAFPSGPGYASTCRYAMQLATLGTELNLLDAYRAQIASVTGETPAGLIPFTFGPNATANFTGTANGQNGPAYTNQGLIILQNPVRPNGGLAARFPKISSALGIDPTMPAAGKVTSQDGKIALNTTTLDLTWAYDLIGDFPAVFSLPAIANSIAGAIPLNIATGGLATEPLQGSSLGDIGFNLAAVLQLPIGYSSILYGTLKTLPIVDGQAFYSTLVPNELPITAAFGLPGTVVNFALKALNSKFILGNPVGDALAPAMKILVNSAYTDVLAPDELSRCATECGTAKAQTWAQLGYTAYDRTFGAYSTPGSVANAATPTSFNSVKTLTPAEEVQKNLDVKAALAAGIKNQLAQPFWGIIVPNPAKSAASAKAVAARTAAPVAAAQAAPAVEAPAPVAVTSAAAPSADPVTPVTPAKPTRSNKSDSNKGGPRAAASTKERVTR